MKSTKILSWIVLGLAGAVGFYYTFWPDMSKYLQMCRQQRYLDERVTEEEQKSLHLKKEQEALGKDPVQIERVAREKLGLSRPRDIIYKFEDEAASSQTIAREKPKR